MGAKFGFDGTWFGWQPLLEGEGTGGGGAGGAGGDNGGKKDDDPNAGGKKGEEPKKVEMTQDELDKLISDRLKRAEKGWKEAAEAERKKADMTEAERLKAEKEAAEKVAKEAGSAAAQRVIRAEAKVVAIAAGVDPKKVDYVLRLADLSAVEVDDKTGEPDAKAIQTAINAVLKDLPELKGTGGAGKGGADFTGGGGGQENPWAKDTFNLTKQGEILRTNPALAEQLQKQAGIKK
jgi:hypothetical protein